MCDGLLRTVVVFAFIAAFVVVAEVHAQPAQRLPPADPMLAMLEQMVREDPTRADSWRLMGRIYRKQNRVDAALNAFHRALDLQPDNVAAHADLGELLDQLGERRGADYHFDQVMLLGPSSSYAAKLVERGIRRAPRMKLETPPRSRMPVASPGFGGIPNALSGNAPDGDDRDVVSDDSLVVPSAYEIQTFDGADDLERRLNDLESDLLTEDNRIRLFLEFGALYNTNIALTPISRELAGDAQASAQGFLSPDIEWIALKNDVFRAGPLMRGYFTINEDDFNALNLASFQPGAFLERDLPSCGGCDFIGRVDYVYSIDLLDGNRFGDRHAVNASLTTILPNTNIYYAYFTTSYSDFAEDGADPSVESLDGPSYTAGVSRFVTTNSLLIPTWSLGADIEFADTVGADFRYQAVNLHGDITFQITDKLSFIPRAGVGYRDYGDFTGPVNRDEVTWRIGGKLKWQCTENFAISGIVGHDRFASDNQDFDTERTEAGIVFTLLR